jgi:hypothetical protein
MSAGWVAGDVRAVAMSRRILGLHGARRIAASKGLADALGALMTTPYSRDIKPDQSLDAAQRAIAATLLWNMRVLAGWAPSAGISMLRVATAWFEIANIEARFRAADAGDQAAGDNAAPFDLGGLATSWRRLADISQDHALREELATTWWGRADDDSARAIGLTMRTRLLDRASSGVPGARAWACGAAALLLAREQLLAERELPPGVRRVLGKILGTAAVDARSLTALQEALPRSASWALVGVNQPADLWLAEAHWWTRVERDGRVLLRSSSLGPEPVIGAIAVMATDAWRTRAALEIAARGGRLEDFDALA